MANRLILPPGYHSSLNIQDTQVAIKLVKDTFERKLAKKLNLTRISAPLFVTPASGLNDNLNGVERPVQFDIPDTGEEVQIVQSLAKWKRLALAKYGFDTGEGLYADMNAIRRDEALDNLHSVYVDQWDWELVIRPEDRTVEYLKGLVEKILDALQQTQDILCDIFPQVPRVLRRDVTYMTTQELEDRYPDLPPSQRENEAVREYGLLFLTQIGGKLRSGIPHDGRAPDYDDWRLNGDILVWNPLLGRAFEISSMGVRVDAESLGAQLTAAGCDDRRELFFHKQLLQGKLPLTAGGGIGQSRICMLLLGKAHIGEVQASVWPQAMIETCRAHGIHLL